MYRYVYNSRDICWTAYIMYGNSGKPSNAVELFIELYSFITQLRPPCVGLESQTRLGTSGPRPLITHKRIRNFNPPLYSSAWTMELITRKSLCRSRWARLTTWLQMHRRMNEWMNDWYIWFWEMNGYERLSDFFLFFFVTKYILSKWIWSQRHCYSLQCSKCADISYFVKL